MLHNRVNNKELKEKMLAETEKRITVSFYKYFNIADTVNYRNNLYLALTKINVFGRIYIANEGINGQISVPESKLQDFKEVLIRFCQPDSIVSIEDVVNRTTRLPY